MSIPSRYALFFADDLDVQPVPSNNLRCHLCTALPKYGICMIIDIYEGSPGASTALICFVGPFDINPSNYGEAKSGFNRSFPHDLNTRES